MARRLLVSGTMRFWMLLLAILVAPRAAQALEPAKHRQLAEVACARVGLPDAFCRRIGKQAFETDYHEWTNLTAHAQRELHQDRCSAADAAVARVATLGDELAGRLQHGELEGAAIAIGRALHTIQDECAHHGMTNQEHAFYSLTDTCSGEDVSPDVQPAALACAVQRTDEVMARVAAAARDTAWHGVAELCIDYSGESPTDSCAPATLPSLFMACDFLAEHEHWDGLDSTWDRTRVGDALVAAFGDGLAGASVSRSVCAGDPAAIDPTTAPPMIEGDLECFRVTLGCLGKVDDAGAIDEATASGCSSGGSPAGLALGVLALVSVAGGRRRRAA